MIPEDFTRKCQVYNKLFCSLFILRENEMIVITQFSHKRVSRESNSNTPLAILFTKSCYSVHF